MTTIFGKIIRGEIACDKVFENDYVFAFKDISPQAPVHILIVPKKEIPDLQSLHREDWRFLSEIVACAQHLAKELSLENGYRLVTNNGPEAGQSVSHLHFHLIGGKRLSDTLG